jgi:hypothetical protein
MYITRATIISRLQSVLEAHPQVLAAWLEGADATATVDDYSDIDFCVSVTPGAIPAVLEFVRSALRRMGSLDLDDCPRLAADQGDAVFHIEGTSPYLLVDFCLYVGRGSQFLLGDEIEKPLILFDRAGVVQFREPDLAQKKDLAKRLDALENTIAQSARIQKYVLRGDFLEAFGYYHKWLLVPLIELLRLRHTQLHPDYYLVHISRHLSPDVLSRLEDLFKVNSVAEIGQKSCQAIGFFRETLAQLRGEED